MEKLRAFYQRVESPRSPRSPPLPFNKNKRSNIKSSRNTNTQLRPKPPVASKNLIVVNSVAKSGASYLSVMQSPKNSAARGISKEGSTLLMPTSTETTINLNEDLMDLLKVEAAPNVFNLNKQLDKDSVVTLNKDDIEELDDEFVVA